MFGVVFPKNPYIGQIFYDVDLKRTFEYVEKDFSSLRRIMKEANSFFKAQLESSLEAQKYIKKRSIDSDIIQKFELGYSGTGSKNFYNYLSISKKISIKNRIDKNLDLKEFLIKTIIGQQISVSAAKSIWENTYPIIKKNKLNENDLKNSGVSNMKQKYIMGINDYLNKNPQHKSRVPIGLERR